MKRLFLAIISFLPIVNSFAQSDNTIYRYFFKADSTYMIIDDSKDNWFSFEFKADTLFQGNENMIIYDNKKLLQINVVPFSEIYNTCIRR
jgi:hypothetical protein